MTPCCLNRKAKFASYLKLQHYKSQNFKWFNETKRGEFISLFSAKINFENKYERKIDNNIYNWI